MIGNNYMVIFVESSRSLTFPGTALQAANFFNRSLFKCPRTDEVKKFSRVTDAWNFVDYLESIDAFDSRDRIVVMSEGETPELGIHFSRCAKGMNFF